MRERWSHVPNATAVPAGSGSPHHRVWQRPTHRRSPRACRPGGSPACRPPQNHARHHGIAHIRAGNEHDLFFLQGYVHAQDRLFQMDASRRQASGTLAELLGPGAIASDVNLRTLGIRRAAERSWPLISARGARRRRGLRRRRQPLRRDARPLPPEYAALEITQFAAVDRARHDHRREVDRLRPVVRPRGHRLHAWRCGPTRRCSARASGAALFSRGSVARAAVLPRVDRARRLGPRRLAAAAAAARGAPRQRPPARPPPASALAREYLDRVRGTTRSSSSASIAATVRARTSGRSPGRHTANGQPLFANDPHLALGTPSTFYPIHLTRWRLRRDGQRLRRRPVRDRRAEPRHRVGMPPSTRWTSPTCTQEQLVPDAASPSGLSYALQGRPRVGDPDPRGVPAQPPGNGVPDDLVVAPPGARSAARHPAGHADRPAPEQRARSCSLTRQPAPRSACSTPASAARARSTTFLDLGPRPQPGRLPERAAVLRLRHAELRSTPTSTATSPTSPAPRCRCARTCRRAP